MEISNSLPNLRNHFQDHQLPPKISNSSNRYDEICLKERLMSELGKEGGIRRHQRTYSDSMLSEQQQQEVPCWLKDLLDDDDDEEPEEDQKQPSTVCSNKTHRRSSSDSLAYLNNKTILQHSPERKIVDSQPSFLQQHHSRTDHSKRAKRYVYIISTKRS